MGAKNGLVEWNRLIIGHMFQQSATQKEGIKITCIQGSQCNPKVNSAISQIEIGDVNF